MGRVENNWHLPPVGEIIKEKGGVKATFFIFKSLYYRGFYMKKIIVLFLVFSLFNFTTLQSNASYKCLNGLKKGTGAVSGLFVSPMIGGMRGFGRGAKIGTDYVSREINGADSSFGSAISFLSGGLVNGALGAFIGIVKGGYEGLTLGYKKPYSKESFALSGKSFTDYPLLSK